jgi:hypothetical protein
LKKYFKYMKTTFFLFLLTASIGVAQAQDAPCTTGTCPSAGYAAPAVVYEAPVTYAAPVVYQAPVVYYAPVFYGTPVSYALNACSACEDNAVRSTVTYIGGGQTRFQVSPRCNTGSTVTYIGGSWFASH